MQENSQEQGTVVKGQREKIKNGQMGIRDLKTRVGRECSISRVGARLYSGGIHVRRVQGESYNVTAGEKLQD